MALPLPFSYAGQFHSQRTFEQDFIPKRIGESDVKNNSSHIYIHMRQERSNGYGACLFFWNVVLTITCQY